MDKLNKIIKNVIIFTAVFLIVNYAMQSCQSEENEQPREEGSVISQTTDEEYSRAQIVTLEIENKTSKEIVIKNDCPGEPLNVYRYEKNEWITQTSNPEIDCANTQDFIIQPDKTVKVAYKNWNHAIFSKMGRFKIEFETEINGENKTITSNEFTIVKEGIIRQLWNALLYRPMYNGLMFIGKMLPGHYFGLSIIILTIIIRSILLIPSHRAMRSQKRMQDIQPRLEKIKQRHKGDQQRIAKETMAIWKEAKVNPLGSCLPLLLQFPFLIALFYVIQAGLNPDDNFLLYNEFKNFKITDLNIFFLGLDLTKPNIYVLPLIVGGLQFLQLKLSFTRAQKKKPKKGKGEEKAEIAMANNMMTYIMPVMIAVFTASLPAGVGIYWGTSTIYGIIQQIFINRESSTPNSPGVKVKVIENNQ